MEPPTKRITNLVRMSQPHKISPMLPFTRLYQMVHDIYSQAEAYASEDKLEKAFVLYLRFVATVTEELPKHQSYEGMTADQKSDLCRRTIRAINDAEKMKRQLLRIFSQETQDFITSQIDFNEQHKFNADKCSQSQSLRFNMKSRIYMTCNSNSNKNLLFQRIVIPNDLAEQFFSQARNEHSFALLYGKFMRKVIVASHIVFKQADEQSLQNIKKIINDPVNNGGDSNELVLIGCVSSSNAEAALLQFIGASLLTEFVFITCKENEKKFCIVHLFSTPEGSNVDGGLIGAFQNINISNVATCENIHITPAISCTVSS